MQNIFWSALLYPASKHFFCSDNEPPPIRAPLFETSPKTPYEDVQVAVYGRVTFVI